MIIVATIDGEKSKTVGIIAKYVTVMDVNTLKSLSVGVAVIAVRTYVDGMCNIWPEDAATDINVLAPSPVPPTMIVEGYAVVTGA